MSTLASQLHDHSPDTAQFLAEVQRGLARRPRTLPCKYFYDQRGSQLFEAICETPEYYPTRTELAIMRENRREIITALGNPCMLIEYGSGSSSKTRLLLEALEEPSAYVPIDISGDFLVEIAGRLADDFPAVHIVPVCADYTRPFALPRVGAGLRRVVYFPGSTIGNMAPSDARKFLCGVARVCGPGGGLLVGVDLKKDRRTLERAYNDAGGITADFNLNLLVRINAELDADFDLAAWSHLSFYNERVGRIEMHLGSAQDQSVRVGGRGYHFEAGERIHTENSYKYSLPEFAVLAERAGFRVDAVWTDPRKLFSVQLFSVS